MGKPSYFCTFLLMGMCLQTDASQGQAERIASIIQKYRVSLAITEHDLPWYVCHHLLAFGKESHILTSHGRTETIPYLVFEARHVNGKPIFAEHEDGSLRPVTSPFPVQRYQDHQNQFLAAILQAAGTDPCASQRPVDIPREYWERMLAGAWRDFDLERDSSWTLLVYAYCLQELPAEPVSVISRTCSILGILADPNSEVRLACDGTHALHAMAVYLKSPLSNLVPQRVNDCVRRRLERAAADLHICNADSKEGSMSSHTYASPFEKDMYVIEQCGHHLEWLVEYFPPSTPRADILSPLVQELCCSLERCQNMQLKRHGAVYHGLRALRIYAEKLRDSEEVLPHTNREMSRCSTEDVFSH